MTPTASMRSGEIQVKICGLTRPEEAVACADLGAQAIGCVFYDGSPRCVSETQARRIGRALPRGVPTVGVFVNESYEAIMRKIERSGLSAVQLHGQEPPELVDRIVEAGLRVIKALFLNGTPSLDSAGDYRPSAFLVERAGGPLPGGNALAWNWSEAAAFCSRHPLILAGGIDPDNVAAAIREVWPDAVDVSSGVERAPGRKDFDKVRRFLDAVAGTSGPRVPRGVFS